MIWYILIFLLIMYDDLMSTLKIDVILSKLIAVIPLQGHLFQAVRDKNDRRN